MKYKKDCFAYQGYGNCKALKEMSCENCKFYKTKKQQEKEIKKYGWLKGVSYERLSEN